MGCRKRHYTSGLIVLFFSWSTTGWSAPVQITAINFKGTGDPSELDIRANGPITFEKQENAQDKQVILEISGATISKSNARKIDTSAFNSKVSLISPYQVPDKPDTVRVVIQLRDVATAEVKQDGNSLKVLIPNEAAPPASAENTTGAANVDQPPPSPDDSSAPPPPASASEAKQDVSKEKSEPTEVAKSPSQKSNLDAYDESKETQKFAGKPITLQLRDVELTDVLRLIGDASGFNTIVGEDVKGKISLSLTDVPWDQALDLVLHTSHLGAERKNSILRVTTLKSLYDEKIEEEKAKRAAEVVIPRINKVFPISYANLGDLQTLLLKFASSATGVPGGVSVSSDGGPPPVVQADNRTNSLVVRDIPDSIERMKRLIEILDTQTPQIMIEAKVIEATEAFSKTLSGSLGFGGAGTTSFVASFAGGNPLDALLGTGGVFATGSAVSNGTSTGAGFGLSPSINFIPGISQLNAILNFGESENQVKIVSSPKLVVLNKEKASIVEGTPVLVPGTTVVPGVGTVPTNTVQQAKIQLDVKPTVTNDGSVLLDLQVSKDVPINLAGGNAGVGTRSITSLVLVESGSTLVMGGIFTLQNSHAASGFPFLKDIPILGALFGSSSDSTERSELFFFVTPRILNLKAAGLKS